MMRFRGTPTIVSIIILAALAITPILVAYYHEQPSYGGSGQRTKEFTIVGEDFKLTPNAIWVEVGDTVKITFTNQGSVIHALVISGFNVRTSVLSPGESETIEFTADREGVFAIYCPVANHRELGMEGVLVVGFPEARTTTVTETVRETVTEMVTATVTLIETVTATKTEVERETITEVVTQMETVTETRVETETVPETVTEEITRIQTRVVTETVSVSDPTTAVAAGVVALIIGIVLGSVIRFRR